MKHLEFGKDIPDPMEPYLAVDRSGPRHECWVTGHMVAGLDGTAAIDGKVGALSTEVDQKLFRQMRQIADVVLVGAETVRKEGYGLVRLSDEAKAQREAEGKPPTPPVAVVTGSLNLNWNLKLFKAAPEHAPTMIITSAAADPDKLAEAKKHATVVIAGEERVEPAAALQALAERGHEVVLCEGGPTLLGEFVAAERLDELCLSIAPVMGGDNLPVGIMPDGGGVHHFELKSVKGEEHTLFLRYEVAKEGSGHE
ncbi:pyrimidine reductase family protein [Yaniella halotolerans]|uniref:pyrimidine reductase family protein n=1 Tax=Yaniella halotolerans TaxID=225453 RepID=UPI0003B51C18|nr:pyrimidine reductase family protein [Yaniella halotolerans]